MRDNMGNFMPPQQTSRPGILETGNIDIADNMLLNLAGNIAVTGALANVAQQVSSNAAENMLNNTRVGGSAKLFAQNTKHLAKAKKGGLISFFFVDNLAGQGLERKLFNDAGISSRFNPWGAMTGTRSGGAKFWAGASALRDPSKRMDYLKLTDPATHKRISQSTAKYGATAAGKSLTKLAVGKQMGRGAVRMAANLGARALAFQEILLPGQVLSVFGPSALGLGDQDFGGIFRAVGQAEKQKQRSGLTLATMSHGFHDNRGAATMRQRAITAIHNTQSSLNQVFGQEALHVHR